MEIPSILAAAAPAGASDLARSRRSFAEFLANPAATAAGFSPECGLPAKTPVAADSRAATTPEEDEAPFLDTDQGRIRVDLEDYFAPRTSSAPQELPPLLLPSEENLQALTDHLEATLPAFLAEHGIPEAPDRITYDEAGTIQFPADYPYASSLREALDEDPAVGREISTAYAMVSHLEAFREAVAFQREYLAASTQGELDAVLARYRDLLSGHRRSPDVALAIEEGCRLVPTVDGEPSPVESGT